MTRYILTTTFLLLSLFACAAAQPRSDGKDLQWDQNLVGLGEIGLVVKYGQADGVPEPNRPLILQMIKDRARELLRKGDVRLLESTDEANMVGKPRLVITLKLKKQTDIPPAMRVETDLYQRVRLSRDPTKEVEASTWNASNIGPEITEQKLVSLLEGQLNAFVKAYQAVNAQPPPVAASNADLLAPVKDRANSLEALNQFVFWCSIATNQVEGVPSIDLPPQIFDPEFRRTLESEAQKKFKRAGIAVVQTDPNRSGRPLFSVMITLNKASFDNYSPAISVVSKVWQKVRLSRNPQIETFQPTWNSLASEGWPITEDAVRKMVISQIDKFIEAYTAANAKPSAP